MSNTQEDVHKKRRKFGCPIGVVRRARRFGITMEPHESNEVRMAREALVYVVVGLAITFGYFLENEVSRLFLKTLLQNSIIDVEKSGVRIKSAVCDRQGEPVGMAKLLGFRVHETSYKSLRQISSTDTTHRGGTFSI